ncbi:uncharacterized protein BJ171DRAFT_507080 [Polychytrium aggregatum]|uniref:uncharacterized protein n=1 Tax=Polychytrium aggregatum TaxID=110093 RepID=UPI0022FEFE2F|nr:uncharacterized protein BJ171DRAFT_507080 [Polychytrium aggregatum]KAI9203935.1 hypothetical protein BJ171DRAFT_507080 [Polychytrium aggregatum]
MATYVAAMIHDYDHPGLNNLFLINTVDPKALLYNDKAVLENHHLSASFSILQKPEYNFLAHLPKVEYKLFREAVIEMVLATDLSQHLTLLSLFKNKLATSYNPYEVREDRLLMLKILMKCSDVSNPSKDWSMYSKWVELISEEFCRQGDIEKLMGLPVSPFMDRENMNIPSCQIGFIDYVVLPLFEAFDKYMHFDGLLDVIRANREKW